MSTDNKTPEIKPEVIALAAKLKPLLKIDAKTGVVTPEVGLYVGSLPEGVTEDTLKAVAKHNAQFVAAASLALGEATLPVMKKHDDLLKATLEVPTVGGDKFNFEIQRSKDVPAFGGKGDPTTRYGHLTASYTMRGARNVGQFAQVKNHLAAAFAGGLAKK